MRSPRCPRLLLLAALLAPTLWLRADAQVAIVARASPDYLGRRVFDGTRPKIESYVLMEGNYYKGTTVDRSIERMSFREIASFLAPELAKQQYLPAPSAAEADLLLVIHWGTTRPYVSNLEMTARDSPLTDKSGDEAIRSSMRESGDPAMAWLSGLDSLSDNQMTFDQLNQTAETINSERAAATNATLLGYNDELHKHSRNSWSSPTERTLRHDLTTERYFIIIKAYDLKPMPNASRRPLWSTHLNIASPGNNFQTALSRMGVVVSLFAGQNLSEIKTLRADVPAGTVTLAPLEILKEQK